MEVDWACGLAGWAGGGMDRAGPAVGRGRSCYCLSLDATVVQWFGGAYVVQRWCRELSWGAVVDSWTRRYSGIGLLLLE